MLKGFNKYILANIHDLYKSNLCRNDEYIYSTVTKYIAEPIPEVSQILESVYFNVIAISLVVIAGKRTEFVFVGPTPNTHSVNCGYHLGLGG